MKRCNARETLQRFSVLASAVLALNAAAFAVGCGIAADTRAERFALWTAAMVLATLALVVPGATQRQQQYDDEYETSPEPGDRDALYVPEEWLDARD